MSGAIGPGDWVECVRSRRLTVGALYCVTEVRRRSAKCKCHGRSPFGLKLSGTPNRFGMSAWCGLNFRPVYRPNSDFIDSLKQPAPEREPEPA